MAPILRRARVVETALWWFPSVGLWLVVAPAPAPPEIVLGAVLAVPCALAATATRATLGSRWRIERCWWRRLGPLLVGAVRETAGLLGRAPDGVVATVDLGAPPDAATRAGREAVATAVLCATPGSVVLDVTDGVVTVHRVAGRPFPGEGSGR